MAQKLEQNPLKGNQKRKGRSRPRLDMTAMVDVAFLLLTFFVLSASLHAIKSIKMTYPPKCEDCMSLQVDEDKMLTLILDKDSKFYHFEGMAENGILKSDFSTKGIRSLLQKHQRKEDPIVVLKATKEAKYGKLIDIIDELIITGHKKYVIAPFSAKDKEALESYLTVN
ncbi:MAG: biopolymer transporter ExbD [Bacteroidia bacterium]|nr:biopolymer transporter ExbD [Bacteroidia bacterium]